MIRVLVSIGLLATVGCTTPEPNAPNAATFVTKEVQAPFRIDSGSEERGGNDRISIFAMGGMRICVVRRDTPTS
jgi:hypothetical protein